MSSTVSAEDVIACQAGGVRVVGWVVCVCACVWLVVMWWVEGCMGVALQRWCVPHVSIVPVDVYAGAHVKRVVLRLFRGAVCMWPGMGAGKGHWWVVVGGGGCLAGARSLAGRLIECVTYL